MLYLSRKVGEAIIINNTVEMVVMEVRGKAVKLGFTFPPEASVLRKEIFDKISEENIAGAELGLEELLGAMNQASQPKESKDD